MAKKQRVARSVAKRSAGLPILVVHAAVAFFTLRDIGKRPNEQVRGPKGFWRLVSSLNTVGAVAYWVIGRKRSSVPDWANDPTAR